MSGNWKNATNTETHGCDEGFVIPKVGVVRLARLAEKMVQGTVEGPMLFSSMQWGQIRIILPPTKIDTNKRNTTNFC